MRLADIWGELFDIPPERWNVELIAWFLRAAYGQGYCDALREPDAGELCRELGYRMPSEAGPASRRGVPAFEGRYRDPATFTTPSGTSWPGVRGNRAASALACRRTPSTTRRLAQAKPAWAAPPRSRQCAHPAP